MNPEQDKTRMADAILSQDSISSLDESSGVEVCSF